MMNAALPEPAVGGEGPFPTVGAGEVSVDREALVELASVLTALERWFLVTRGPEHRAEVARAYAALVPGDGPLVASLQQERSRSVLERLLGGRLFRCPVTYPAKEQGQGMEHR